MFRVILYLLFAVVLISILRGVIGMVARVFSTLINAGQATPQRRSSPQQEVPLTGELKKDPSCGTYISAASSLKESVGGQTFYFCSKECRDKYVASAAR